ncbi:MULTISPECIES: helix-turn-helix transcriptional regulator [unclassified Coleofasciculus]|uniref:helix-turn-helix domain-containing protein n=1 Tax=Cyanophyceae TaxID=3028117 RepID=UPI001682EE92|nr:MULTISPECIES: helix-turn-helix transcriptional regulator [unclassified Coleofasciculus]MBD1889134.1 helix-turn-helix transcriptional regulator [Coleofasciculus sp. FACHB-SPT9]MBD2084910.1 helix-turn-helix transcriptional regulator [Coleofasciculus sp. FACHB-542]
MRRRFTDEGLRQMGNFLRACREAKGLSVHKLSEQTKEYEARFYEGLGEPLPKVLGVSIAAISRIENGNLNKPAPDILWILLDVLKPEHPTENRILTLEDLLLIGTEAWNPNIGD